MNKIKKTFDLFPYSFKDISPHDFLVMDKEEKKNIKSINIIPPQIGKYGFGKIRVEFKMPLYEVGQEHER